MFDKIRKGLSEAAKELKEASEAGGWKDKLGQLAADNPQLPLSGLVGGQRQRGAKPPEFVTRQEEALPAASLRDEALEARVVEAARGWAPLARISPERAILSNSQWIPARKPEAPQGPPWGRERMAYVVGRTDDERHLVYSVVFREAARSASPELDLDDAESFSGVLELYHVDSRIHEVPAAAAAAELTLKRRVEVSPVLIQNTLDVAIKVQSSNSATDDYEDLIVPPRSEKSFNYYVESDAFFVREQSTSRLLLSLDPKAPGFGFTPIRV